MKGRRRHASWQGLRAPEGGVHLQPAPDPADELLRRMRDYYVRQYDEAIARSDAEATARLARALRDLDVRV